MALYSALTLRLWPASLAEFRARFDDIFLGQNYLLLCAGCRLDADHHCDTGAEGPADGFTWRSERQPLSSPHRLVHAVHDLSVPLFIIVVLVVSWLGFQCCAACCCRRGARRKVKVQ